MKSRNLLLVLLCLLGTIVHAQLSVPGTPPSFLNDLGFESVHQVSVPALDMATIEQQDMQDEAAGMPPRFGFPQDVSLDLTNSGTWTDLDRGERIWRLRIAAPDAKSINLLYDNFFMPAGARLFIYNTDKTHVIGAFSEINNKQTGKFASGLVYGDEIVLEYYEPLAVRGQGAISIAKVVHGYRYIPDFAVETEEVFGSSGACQVNVNCSEGAAWQDHKRSVAMILVSGTRWCTGSLMNTTSGSCTPYFLTADHCLTGGLDALGTTDASNWSFYWNYESAGCADGSDFLPPSTNGATLVANDSPSDFALFLLTEDPAANAAVNPYYNGWDATTTIGSGGVGIHHPAGDIKKIATHSITPAADDWFGTSPAGSHWEVFWDATANGQSVTEGGSSGSPMYNAAGRVVGQLHGGSSINCSNPSADPGIYGAMWYSWTNAGATNNARKLQPWLDDAGTGALVFDGVTAANCGTTGGPCLTYCPSVSNNSAFEWVANVTLGGLNNSSGDDGGYVDFGAIAGAEYKLGNSYPLSLTPGFAATTYGEWFKVYIDYNGDGDFDDAGEEVFDAGGTVTSTITGSISIPSSATPGQTGMRVIMRYNTAPTSGCDDGYSFGETEDYCITIVDPCGDYCASSGGSASEWAETVTIGSYTNSSGNNGGYIDFGQIGLDLARGSSVAYALTPGYPVGGTMWNEYWDVWIDFNNDGDFDDAGEQVVTTPINTNTTVSGSFTIPAGANLGLAKMRVRMNFSSATIGLACGTYSFGETEDYCINIVDGCNAATAPTGLSSTVTATQVQLTWNSISGSAGCRVNGGPVPSFAGSATLPIPGVSSLNIPVATLPPGNYNWAVTCACSISPLILTPTSAPDFFTVPAPRLGNLAELGLAPNPATDNIRVSYEALESGDQLVQVTDILGQLMLTENVVAGQGFNTHVINLSDLAAGTYFLTIGQGEDRQVKQFEVIR